MASDGILDDFSKVNKRIKQIGDWLTLRHPECFTEQKHLDAGSLERAYWHYGYMKALHDVAKLLTETAHGK